LAPEESASLIGAAREHFADADFLLEAGSSGRWYFSAAGIADARLAPPDEAQTGTFEAIPAGADGRRLARMLTELQMLWHGHPVNRARHRDGRPEANALWVWEGGRLPPSPRLAAQPTLFASAPEISGLALWAGLQHSPLDSFDAVSSDGVPVVAIEADEGALGSEWLRRFDARRREFRLFVDGAVQALPARRGLFASRSR
ncbi:MAG TPA: hypothetical protein VFX38_08280, partial [Gammaproteobacteria bacterium]|nr:hypothetical protein [Gammaproteobacteria bacterium]